MDSLKVEGYRPIPIRRQLAAQLRHVIEGGGIPRDQALPSIRALGGFLGIDPHTVARVIADLKRGGYVEARRGEGLFAAQAAPAPPSRDLPEVPLTAVLDAQGQPIKLEDARSEPTLRFTTSGSERLDPGQEATQFLDVEFPAAALKGKTLKDIRLEFAYIPSPYREESVNFAVSIGAAK